MTPFRCDHDQVALDPNNEVQMNDFASVSPEEWSHFKEYGALSGCLEECADARCLAATIPQKASSSKSPLSKRESLPLSLPCARLAKKKGESP